MITTLLAVLKHTFYYITELHLDFFPLSEEEGSDLRTAVCVSSEHVKTRKKFKRILMMCQVLLCQEILRYTFY
jgi:hypothetical protein